ncbi:PHP domain-containing protein [Paenibacillus yanchengensis]|uniref:PHP domain-containing protein n=1 Tax=Paenibacillus yanchengensis TaxID=2035833 RepID=A0ABW4YN66_9BACL
MVEQKIIEADLHMHTTASDGILTPAELVQAAEKTSLSAIAITDHDTVFGVKEAIKIASKQLVIIAGVEISTVFQQTEIHILGYFIDVDNELLLTRLASQRNARDRRNELIINKLQQLGVSITMEQFLSRYEQERAAQHSIGRPHIAQLLIEIGVVPSMDEAFRLYLATGAQAFVAVPRITPEEASAWIREAGGVSVIAHPGIYQQDEYVEQLIAKGMVDGIEVYHSDHTELQQQFYLELATQYHKLVTGGSDFHGIRNGVSYHGDLGQRGVSMHEVEQLRRATQA